MTLPEGRQPIEAQDMAKMHPSTWEAEAKALRAAITHALARLDASLFTNAEHQQAKDTLRAALEPHTATHSANSTPPQG
jgi:hypothetical protein